MVAELSGNHGGKIENALKMIEAAAKAGADAVKIQSYTPDTITIDHDGPGFVIESGLWQGHTLYQLYQKAHTPFEWHPQLFEHARRIGIPLLSSPFDDSAVELLESLGCPAYKIASFELVDVNLIRRVAATGKPLILSTGMATLEEIQEAVDAVYSVQSHGPMILLHCTSGYPTPVSEANLSTMALLHEHFNVPVGLSDHTQGNSVAVAAVALGACLVEKHFLLSRKVGGVDAEFSLEPQEFDCLVGTCQTAFQALGKRAVGITDSERHHVMNRRSLYAVTDIPVDTPITQNHVRSIRPGFGLHPQALSRLLGKRARYPISKGTPMSWDLVY